MDPEYLAFFGLAKDPDTPIAILTAGIAKAYGIEATALYKDHADLKIVWKSTIDHKHILFLISDYFMNAPLEAQASLINAMIASIANNTRPVYPGAVLRYLNSKKFVEHHRRTWMARRNWVEAPKGLIEKAKKLVDEGSITQDEFDMTAIGVATQSVIGADASSVFKAVWVDPMIQKYSEDEQKAILYGAIKWASMPLKSSPVAEVKSLCHQYIVDHNVAMSEEFANNYFIEEE